jgi:tetratricopeptide (TPR) repeat protein
VGSGTPPDDPPDHAPTELGASTLAGVPPPPSSSSPRRSGPASGLVVGDRLGRYVIERPVGAGGMGEVYAAHDPQLDRRVAIKVLRPAHRQPLAAARLLREAQALARLEHPNVVTIYDAGETDGRVFLAMQYVEGATLGEHLAAARPPWPRIVELFVAAGRGLAAAHAAGLIHRDFKPSNVLVDGAGVARVTDFGVARAADEAIEPGAPSPPAAATELADSVTPLSSDMTEAGAVIGTPAFMAPEQHAGQRGTARSDQFAFATSLWQALFGHHPFVPLDHGPVGSALEYIALVGEGALQPPPAGHPVPRRIVAALTRALARQPEARWPTMTALLAELDEPSVSPRAAVIALSAMAALGIGAALWFGLTGGGGAAPGAACAADADRRLAAAWSPARAIAVDLGFAASGRPHGPAAALLARAGLDRYAEAWRDQAHARCAAASGAAASDPAFAPLVASREACLADALAGLAGTVDTLVAGAVPALVDHVGEVIDGLPELAVCADPERMAAISAPPIAIALRLEPLRARLAGLEARLVAGLVRQVADELPALRREIELLGWAPLQVDLELLDGDLALADLAPRREPYLAAARLAMQRGLRDETAAAWAAVLKVEGLAGSVDGVESYHQIAAAAAAASGAPERVLRERIAHGRALLRRGEGARAAELCDAALADARATAGVDRRDLGAARDCALECAVRAGLSTQARALAAEGMASLRDLLGEDHPANADYLSVEAWAAGVEGRPDLARAALARGLAIRERAFGPRHVRVAESLVDLAQLESDPRARAASLERALAIAEDPRTAGTRGPHVAATAHSALAELAADAGNLEAMQRHFERAIEIRRAEAGPRSLEVAFLLLGYGQYLSQLDLARSLATLAESEALLAARGDPRVAIARGARAHILGGAGRWAEALPLLRQLVPTLPPDAEPFNLGLTWLDLARALRATRGDRGELRTAALTARQYLLRAGEPARDLVAEVDALLGRR